MRRRRAHPWLFTLDFLLCVGAFISGQLLLGLALVAVDAWLLLR